MFSSVANYKETPLYTYDGAYAREHDKLPLYRESYQANIACKDAIDKAIGDNYRDSRLNSGEVMKAVCTEFSIERISYVLANTVQFKEYDGRISHANKKWAKTIPVVPNADSWGGDRNCYFVLDSHSGLIDLFINYFRKKADKCLQEEE